MAELDTPGLSGSKSACNSPIRRFRLKPVDDHSPGCIIALAQIEAPPHDPSLRDRGHSRRWYDLDNEGLCHVIANADRVTRPPRAVIHHPMRHFL